MNEEHLKPQTHAPTSKCTLTHTHTRECIHKNNINAFLAYIGYCVRQSANNLEIKLQYDIAFIISSEATNMRVILEV